jgi:hypothetical protein
MSHAVALLLERRADGTPAHSVVAPGADANIIHRDEHGTGTYYQIRPVGEGLEQWFARFQAEQRADGVTAERFYEVLPRDAITRFSFKFASTDSDVQRIVSACGYVAHKLLSAPSYEASDVSYWYRLDGFVYGVWPMIAMNALDRQAACDILATGGQDQYTPFSASWMDHYHIDNHRRIEFPLPASGAQFIGVFDHEGLAKRYSLSRQGRRMSHLVVNGGFIFNSDPAIGALQITNVYQALRIGLLTNLVVTRDRTQTAKDPGYNAQVTNRRTIIRESIRLRREAPAVNAAAPRRELDRLNWIQALDVFDAESSVVTLMDCLLRDSAEANEGDLPEYFHTFNQMNRWFLYEVGCSPARLWHKTYDHKRYMCDSERPERYLTIEIINVQTVRQLLDRIKVMVPNPGKPVPRFINVIDAWLSHPHHNAVNAVVVCPLASEAPMINPYKIRGQFNKWRGWDFYSHGHADRLHEKYHGLSLAQVGNLPDVREINAFIFGMLCNQDLDCFRMITLILANVLQRPDSKPEKAVFLKGPEGVGKSLFSKNMMKRVFGFNHSTEFDRTDHIVGNFNEATSGMAMVFLEEALFGGDKETCGRFQQLVTGEFQAINGKYQAVRLELNLTTFWANTNRDFPIAVNQNGRRYVFVAVSNLVMYLNSKRKTGFFNRIAELLESDSILLYAYFLSRIPLDEWFRVRSTTVIENAELGKQKLMSMSSEKPMAAWLMGCAAARTFGRPEGNDHDICWDSPAPLSGLYELFVKTRKYAPGLAMFSHDLCIALGGVKGFDARYTADQRLNRSHNSATWVYLPSYEDALQTLQSRMGGTADVGSIEYVEKHLEHEGKMMKLSKEEVTAQKLLPPYETLLDAMPLDATLDQALMVALFGAVDRVVVPCQKE